MPIIRPLLAADLPAALALVESVGWNQTERDLRLFLESPGNLYLAAEIEGQVVGTVASIDYGGEVAWISMMIVAEAFRGRGLSKLLLSDVIGQLRARDYRAIKLDATPAGRPVYLKLGFREEYIVHRLTGSGHFQGSRPARVASGTREDLRQVIELDKRIFGADRSALLSRLAEDDRWYVLKMEDEIVAYAFCRTGRRFYQLGPAGGIALAYVRPLLEALLVDLAGKPVVVDVLADQEALHNWLIALGFQFQRPFYRMFLDAGNVAGRIADHYLIAGPEFG